MRYDKDGNPNVQVTEEHSVPANATSYIISGLDSTQHYIVGITAATKMGEGSVPSEPTDFTTSELLYYLGLCLDYVSLLFVL